MIRMTIIAPSFTMSLIWCDFHCAEEAAWHEIHFSFSYGAASAAMVYKASRAACRLLTGMRGRFGAHFTMDARFYLCAASWLFWYFRRAMHAKRKCLTALMLLFISAAYALLYRLIFDEAWWETQARTALIFSPRHAHCSQLMAHALPMTPRFTDTIEISA